MFSLHDLKDFLKDFPPPLTVFLLTVAAVLALCLALLAGRRRPGQRGERSSRSGGASLPALDVGSREGSDYWGPPDRPAGERRRTPRRPGNPVEVTVLGLGGFGDDRGVIKDRSSAGLGLWVRRPVEPGAYLRVRACNAPDGTPWAELRVRWCRMEKDYFELGGDFVQPPPVGVLLTFG